MAVQLKAGSRLRDYTLIVDTMTSDAGTSLWGFAEKDDEHYFLKCYLSPTYPSDEAPGSEKSKRTKRQRCRLFEQQTRVVEAALARCGDQAFLVGAVDFFREQGSYFKVTPKINADRVAVPKLPPNKQLLVLLTAAFGLKSLHGRSALIHGDLKPENILLRRIGNRYVAHIVDFDASFFSHAPPQRDHLIGDQRYWAPEMVEYLRSETPTQVSQKADVFSLGLVFCHYLYGRLPDFPEPFSYAGEALLHDAELQLPPPRHEEMAPAGRLVEKMLAKDPRRRPAMSSVHEELRRLNKKLFVRRKTLDRLQTRLKTRWEQQSVVISSTAANLKDRVRRQNSEKAKKR